jgi:hypothetical protein
MPSDVLERYASELRCARGGLVTHVGADALLAFAAEVERLQAICRGALSEIRLGCSYSVEGEHQKADEHFEALEDALRAALGEGEDDG